MMSTRISRREFLQLGAGATAAVALAGSGMATLLSRQARGATLTLTPFVDELPIPPVLKGKKLTLTIQQTTQQFHSELPASNVWGYSGGGYNGYLGPTIEAVKGKPTTVTYRNRLPANHLFTIPPLPQVQEADQQMHVSQAAMDTRILTHLHGGHISAEADGNPYATPDEFVSGQNQTVTYRNDQEAAHLWYHDHALGITRLNVMAGLAGHRLTRDKVDDGKGGKFRKQPGSGLPFGAYEIPLAIQDRTFTSDGQLDYPSIWEPEFFGDVVCVNGKVWPLKHDEPRRYRMRILNGSNSRFYNLQLTGGATMHQIGTDGGLLAQPVALDKLLLGPGERADVIFDFTGLSDNVDLVDTALPPTTVSPATDLQRPEIMRFQVDVPLKRSIPNKALPNPLGGAFSVPGQVASTRFLTLEEQLDASGMPVKLLLNGMRFEDRPVTERPKLGDTEVWALINISADTHPIHLHLVQFEVLRRQQLDVDGYQQALNAARAAAGGPVNANGQLVTPNNPEQYFRANLPVDANEKGPKDTVRANPNEVTFIKAKFDIAGKYVWHCHILEHEDNDMMRPYDVV
jgi:spore coat protein A, manganese oxidase